MGIDASPRLAMRRRSRDAIDDLAIVVLRISRCGLAQPVNHLDYISSDLAYGMRCHIVAPCFNRFEQPPEHIPEGTFCALDERMNDSEILHFEKSQFNETHQTTTGEHHLAKAAAEQVNTSKILTKSAGGGDRTRTTLSGHRILS
jgi:hypothetical protein